MLIYTIGIRLYNIVIEKMTICQCMYIYYIYYMYRLHIKLIIHPTAFPH